jgi:2,3,4,5-tetrahydropyridine-2-carboxylate N-succinyltransferase
VQNSSDNNSNIELNELAGHDELRNVDKIVEELTIDVDDQPKSAQDVYLRLHALSMRLVKPNCVNLHNVYSLLNNVVWTDFGPCATESYNSTRVAFQAKFGRQPSIYAIDKFPRMVDYVMPTSVRIGDVNRVRLGAYLSPGTTVMQAGFVNFNAGTFGESMVEGRVSQGVVVGNGSDIGGGASTMGTLSGGGKEYIRIGQRTLLGANAGIGISLGDDCIVESGLYITAGTKVEFNGAVVKARELSGKNNLLFIRNSQTGAVHAKLRDSSKIDAPLNPVLHQHN